nr:nucleotidyl transferase AbiEii/AbiGii toxin family protein [Actinokineospora sp. NBRC 105648]
MTSQRPRTPGGYLASQKNRAKIRSKETGAPVGELLQLHFHRRLIARVFHGDEAVDWVLKGGQALLVRWPTARYSTDIDLLSTQATTDAAVAALRTAAALRLDDEIWFDHISTSQQTHVERPTRKVRFMAMFENAPLKHTVNVDVVVSRQMPRGVVTTEPLEPAFATDCDPWPAARVFPIEDHVAEKICAMYERHRAGGNPSTQYKDLVDLILFALNVPLVGTKVHHILRDEVDRRTGRGMVVELPDRFQVPDLQSWTGGYRRAAQGVSELPPELRSLAGASGLADAFLTPLLKSRPPTGVWHPDQQIWQ